VASLSQGRTAASQCGLFTYKSVPVILNQLVVVALIVDWDGLAVCCDVY